MDFGNALVTSRPLSVGRDVGPDEKYREGIWVQAILGREHQTQSDGLPRFHDVFIRPSSYRFIEEPLDESEDVFDESLVEAEVEECKIRELKDVPDYSNVYSERDRLKTFGPWKQSYHVTPLDLAKNGFVYRGPEDRAKCVYCRKIIYQWEEGDVVEDEHRRISPKCPFLLGECNHLNRAILSGDRLTEDFRLNMRSSISKRYPAFADAKLREETFVNWYNISHYCPKSLSEAGFFYTGKGDCVTCHQCGVRIQQWEARDDPWTIHAQHNPRCDFLLKRSTRTQTWNSERIVN